VPLFRRRRADSEELDDEFDDDLEGLEDDSDDDEPSEPATYVRPERLVTTGPWDVEDAPDDGMNRLDLGALLIPVPDGCEVRVDVQPDHVVAAATVVHGHSAIQIHAFAAPRTGGLWEDVRKEIADSLRGSGGSSEDSTGPFGAELRARIPTEVPGQGVHQQAARFVGVDGPRWFLRGLMTGPAATDPNQARVLESAFRNVVVVRGGEAMAPRDLIPLKLPKEAAAALPQAEEANPEGERPRPTLEMLERGPEITETR
jgi:hypothetical protein